MADDRIGLGCAQTPVMNIVPGRVPPVHRQGQQHPQRQHGDHASTQIQKWVSTQDATAPHTSLLDARRLWVRASKGSARRGLLVFLRLWRAEARSALRNRGDASRRWRAFSLPIGVIGNGTMTQGAARHGFENRHRCLLSDTAKQNNNILAKKK